MGLSDFILSLGLLFVPLTGVVAYLLAYEEYERHAIAPAQGKAA